MSFYSSLFKLGFKWICTLHLAAMSRLLICNSPFFLCNLLKLDLLLEFFLNTSADCMLWCYLTCFFVFCTFKLKLMDFYIFDGFLSVTVTLLFDAQIFSFLACKSIFRLTPES